MTEHRATELVLVRHGETEWNSHRRCQGHLDIPLSEKGMRQSRAVAQAVAGGNWAALYSSDLARASMTAQAIAETTGLPVRLDERLRERALGILQGLTHTEFRDRHPEDFAAFYGNDSDWVIPGGESQQQASDRMVAACQSIANAHPGQRVLVVTHGGSIGCLMKWVMGLPAQSARRWSIFNCALHTFQVHGDAWRMMRWGETAHLNDHAAMDGVSL